MIGVAALLLAGCMDGRAPVDRPVQQTADITPTVMPSLTPEPSSTPTLVPTLSPFMLTADTLPDLWQTGSIAVNTRLFGVDVSPDHTAVAVGTLGGEVLIYSLPGGDLAATLDRHDTRVYRVLYSPDGSRLYSASRDGAVMVWDTATWERLFAVRTPREASALAIAPDGSTFAAGGYYSARGMVWDSREGAFLAALEGHLTRFRSVVYAPTGDMVVTGDFDGLVILRDTYWYEPLASIDFEWGEASSLAISPDGGTLAVGMSQTHLFLYDLHEMAIRADLAAHGGSINDLLFTPDGSVLISVGVDGDIGFWDPLSGENLRYIAQGSGAINDLSLSPDGQLMATAGEDGIIRLYTISP